MAAAAESTMPQRPPTIPLPTSWNANIRSAMLHVIALAQSATAHTRGWAANSLNARVRLQAENDRLWQEVAPLRTAIIEECCGRLLGDGPHLRLRGDLAARLPAERLAAG